MKLFLLFALLPAVLGALTVLERDVAYRGAPAPWLRTTRAIAHEELNLILALKQRNIDVLERTLLRTSDPNHADYGKHLTFEQVNELVAPSTESVAAVLGWLESNGLNTSLAQFSPARDFISLTVTVAQAESLLSAKYALFVDPASGQEVVRTNAYAAPAEIAAHLDVIAPTVHFPIVQSQRKPQRSASSLARDPTPTFNTPENLRKLYQATGVIGKAKGNRMGFASFLEQYFDNVDLQEFFLLFQNFSLGRTVEKVFGPNDPSKPGMEAALDQQYLMGVGAGIETWAWYTAGRAPDNPENEPFLTWLQNVSSTNPAPQVLSVSYGEDEKSVSLDYATRTNNEFMKLGARGISIFFASGDNGAGGNCSRTQRFTPNFPAGSPWVTAVGGTFLGTPGDVPTGEIADVISGGGFSDYWARPQWQNAAVENFIKNGRGNPPPELWNQTGRGYPDIAAQSELYIVVMDLIPLPGVGGTSAASPTTAGIFALLNDLRIQNGKTALGFLNPLLYQLGAQNPSAFNDVVVGQIMACGLHTFKAIPGWDPTTGWGTPNYAVLSKAVLALP